MAQKKSMLNRTIAPPIKDAVEFELVLPPYQKHTLKNGIEGLLKHYVPEVTAVEAV